MCVDDTTALLWNESFKFISIDRLLALKNIELKRTSNSFLIILQVIKQIAQITANNLKIILNKFNNN